MDGRISNFMQAASIRRYEMTEGKERGLKVIDCDNGKMRFLLNESNDYNLNIPRYVDTFEEEPEIDIKAVMAEIKELESQRAELDKEIDKYLKELGILED